MHTVHSVMGMFVSRISHLIEVETELERLNYQLKQKDRKSDGFLKTIEEKDQEIVKLENRLKYVI